MCKSVATDLVPILQPSGIELNAYVVLQNNPARRAQKIKTLSSYVQRHPSGWKKRLELADLLYETGEWNDAVAHYQTVLQRQPGLVNTGLQLGRLLQFMGRQAEAIRIYEHFSRVSQTEATRLHFQGALALCRRQYTAAAAAFQAAALLETDNPAHPHALGQVYLTLEAPLDALQAFEAVLNISPGDTVALSHCYDLLVALGELRKAETCLQHAYAFAPTNIQILTRAIQQRCRKGFVKGEAGKHTKRLIHAALRLSPHAVETHDAMANYYFKRGDKAKGIAVLQQFIDQHPKNPGIWLSYASLLYQAGNTQSAAEAILHTYQLYSQQSGIYRSICEILPAAGKKNELQPFLNEMLEHFPHCWSVWAQQDGRLSNTSDRSNTGVKFLSGRLKFNRTLRMPGFSMAACWRWREDIRTRSAPCNRDGRFYRKKIHARKPSMPLSG